ncbi:MAG: 1-deoxy-D-xylulose-5-phosphate synthase, partial [Erysipelotrichales bacterium]|nr:1-deoxy-D-xylulose-5-phosphate synthase [Erysipelotrichales bacterium]
SSIRTSDLYIESKSDIRNSLMKSKNGKVLLEKLIKLRRTIKKKLFKDSLFYDFGVDYLGPIDGHNVYELERALQMAKTHHGPILVHVLTDKGKGYKAAEEDKNGDWHGVGPFEVESAKKIGGVKDGYVSYSQAVTEYLVKRGESDEKLFVITPAMIAGSQLQEFFAKYPERSIDCGIAEEHAVTLGAGLANGGMHPFVSIYSSFMQRAYDQINHDVARMNLPVVFGVDRAGIVGEDGETHHGVFDISFLRSIPNVVIAHPKDYAELHGMLETGFNSHCPFFVRYPRGNTKRMDVSTLPNVPVGTFEILHKVDIPKLVVFTYGEETVRMVEIVREQELPVIFVNARYLKPLDEAMLADLLQYDCDWLCVEDGMLIGGLGEALLGYVNDRGVSKRVHRRGITDHFVRHASMSELRNEEKISGEALLEAIKELIA